jgi:ketosteroid isomerase-like protein
MSQENAESLRLAVDAFNRRDRAAFLALCDPELENFPPRDWPESDPIRGYEAVWSFFVGAQDAWEEGPFELVELVDAGNDKVVADVRREVRGKASGASVAWSYWLVVTYRNGKPWRMEWFADRAEALEGAGLRE